MSATASVWQERRAAEKQLKERVQSVLDTYGCCVAGSLIPGTEKFGMLPEKLMEDLLYLADEILIEADGSAHMPVKAPAEHDRFCFPTWMKLSLSWGHMRLENHCGKCATESTMQKNF